MSSNLTTVKHYPGYGETVHFFHANGFPVGVYEQFLNELSQSFNVHALEGHATWPQSTLPKNRGWQVYADDLIEFIEDLGYPIIAIGHSTGVSSTLLATTKRPDLFKAIVLIEPAMVTRPLGTLVK